MRVTERSQMQMMLNAQSRAETRLDSASRVAGLAARVTKPSDDPTAYGTLIRKNFAIELLEQHTDIATQAQGELDIAQNALSKGVDLLTRAREIAVTGANNTADAPARKLMGDEILMIRGQLLAAANTRHANKFLFGGTKTDVAPFGTDGVFVGNDQIVTVPIMEGVSAPITISGAKAFTAVGGRDIFTDLTNLATALQNNDVTNISGALKPLEDGTHQIVRAQVDAGFGTERFKTAVDILAATKEAIAGQMEREITGDSAAQLTELTLARTAYERSLAVTKELLSVSGRSG
jgi:flagellar hook-associated protein 3 FlgL